MKTKFGDRMKRYESELNYTVDTTKYTVLRLDWHWFSKFTKKFEKPFDMRIYNIINKVVEDLFYEFNPITWFTQSDEITLIFKPSENFIYNGRINKLLSLTSAFATARFNFYLSQELIGSNDEILINKIWLAFFDCRIMSMPNETEAFNMLLWRMKDCATNSRNTYSQEYISYKELQGVASYDAIKICNEKTWNDWNNLIEGLKYWTLFKKADFINNEGFLRTIVKQFHIDMSFSEEMVNFMLLDKIPLNN